VHRRGDKETPIGRQRPGTASHAELKQGFRPAPHRAAHARQRPTAVQVRDPADGPDLYNGPVRSAPVIHY